MTQQKIHSLDETIKLLTSDELSRLFFVFCQNADLFSKLIPNTPFFDMIKRGDTNQAWLLMQHFHSKKS